MSEDPRRLLDDAPSDLVRALLEAAREEAPRDASMKRTLMAVGAGATVLGSGAAASAGSAAVAAASTAKLGAATGTAGAGLFLKWAGVGLATGLAAAGITESVRPYEPTPKSAVLLVEKAAPTAKALDIPETPRVELPPAMPEAAAPIASLGEPAPTTPAPRPRKAEPSAPLPSLLAEEVRALDRARSSLSSGDPSRAISLLDRYEREIPKGTLRPEALYLRAEALVELGDLDEAASVAKRLLASRPDGPHARRARAILEASSR